MLKIQYSLYTTNKQSRRVILPHKADADLERRARKKIADPIHVLSRIRTAENLSLHKQLLVEYGLKLLTTKGCGSS